MILLYLGVVLWRKWHDIFANVNNNWFNMTKTDNWMQHTITEIAEMCDLEIKDSMLQIDSTASFKQTLTDIIAFLIDHNFEKLLWILYRIDVDEEKAKSLLSKHIPEEAPAILAELILQRQLKKEEFKKQFEQSALLSNDDDDLRL